VVEKSVDLAGWTPVSDSLFTATMDSEIRQAIVPGTLNAPQLFLRLRITITP
jgi:hypothetical protein